MTSLKIPPPQPVRATPPNAVDAEPAPPAESFRKRFETTPLPAANAFPAAPAIWPWWPVLPIQPATGFRRLGARGLGNTRLASERGSPSAHTESNGRSLKKPLARGLRPFDVEAGFPVHSFTQSFFIAFAISCIRALVKSIKPSKPHV